MAKLKEPKLCEDRGRFFVLNRDFSKIHLICTTSLDSGLRRNDKISNLSTA